MAKHPTQWSSAETLRRVLAAVIATGVKLDLKTVAMYYGTTYDTIENGLRPIKKEAKVLKEEVDSGTRGEIATPSRAKSSTAGTSTPRKKTPKKAALESVNTGRITKNTKNKIGGGSVKPESESEDVSVGGSSHHEFATPAADSMFDFNDMFNLRNDMLV